LNFDKLNQELIKEKVGQANVQPFLL